jgi:hypothetical protein
VEVKEVRWDEGGAEPSDEYTFFYGNGNADHHLGTGFFLHKRIILTINRVEFSSDRMSSVSVSQLEVSKLYLRGPRVE